MLQYRYDRYDRFRIETIQLIKQQRDQLINQSSNNQSVESHHHKNSLDSFTPSALEIMCDSFIDKERKALQKIKFRQREEIKATLEKEAKMANMRNMQLEKEKKQFEKIEMEQYNKMIEERKKDRYNKKIHEYSQNMDDMSVGLSLGKREYEEVNIYQKRSGLYSHSSHNNNNDTSAIGIGNGNCNENGNKGERGSSAQLDNDQTNKGNNNNSNNYPNRQTPTIDSYIEQRIQKAKSRRLFQEQKDKKRKERQEKERIEKLILAERQKIQVDRRLCKTRTANDLSIRKLQNQILTKQNKSESKLKECTSLREMAFKKKKEQEELKYQNIINVLHQANEEEKKRLKLINTKAEKNNQLVSLREASRRLTINKRSQSLRNLIIRAIDVRTELEKESEMKKIGISLKIENIQKRCEEGTKIKEKQNSIKKEDSSVFRYEKEKIIQRLNRVKDFQSEETGISIIEKRKKIDEYKQQQIKLLKSKTKMVNSIAQEKKELIDKFDQMMYQTKKINAQTIKKLFPDDKELLMIVKDFQEQKPSEGNSISNSNHSSTKGKNKLNTTSPSGGVTVRSNYFNYNGNGNGGVNSIVPNSSSSRYISKGNKDNSNSNSNRYDDNETLEKIMNETKVDEYHKKLLKELSVVIEEEKEKEKERVIAFEKEESIEKKRILEKKMHNDRENAKQSICLLQNSIETKVNEYKNGLSASINH